MKQISRHFRLVVVFAASVVSVFIPDNVSADDPTADHMWSSCLAVVFILSLALWIKVIQERPTEDLKEKLEKNEVSVSASEKTAMLVVVPPIEGMVGPEKFLLHYSY